MISISRERERERERDAHTHTGTHIDTRFSHCWNTLQRLSWGIPKDSSTSFEPAIPLTTALKSNHYTTYFPPKYEEIFIDIITKCYGMISRERERERETHTHTHRHTHRHTIFTLLKHSAKVITRQFWWLTTTPRISRQNAVTFPLT